MKHTEEFRYTFSNIQFFRLIRNEKLAATCSKHTTENFNTELALKYYETDQLFVLRILRKTPLQNYV